MGTRTFGKGSVQQLYWLGRQDACLKLTVAHYYLPNGKCIHKEEFATEWGVEPDVKVEMTNQQRVNAIRSRQAMEVLREDGSTPEVTLDPKKGPENAQSALMKDGRAALGGGLADANAARRRGGDVIEW